VYRKPTRLFELIDAGDDESAVLRLKSHPLEASTWLVSRRGAPHGGGDENGDPRGFGVAGGKKNRDGDGDDDNGVKWRYLPLHLACLQPSPSLPLIQSVLEAYPPAIRRRDRAGNLPVHYVCLEGTEDDWEVLQFLLDAYPDSLRKSSGDGRTLTQLVQDMGNSDEGSLATNGTIVARVTDFTLRREANVVGCHREQHGHSDKERGEDHRQDIFADERPQPQGQGEEFARRRSKSRAKSRGRSTRRGSSRELRDAPPPIEDEHCNDDARGRHQRRHRQHPPALVEKKHSADSSSTSNGKNGSRSSKSGGSKGGGSSSNGVSRQGSKRQGHRSKSRGRRSRRGTDEPAQLSSSLVGGAPTPAVIGVEDEERALLQKRVRELEGKLDMALTERDALTETSEEIAEKSRSRTREVRALRRKLDDAMADADECRVAAEAERRRADDLEEQLREGRERNEELQGRAEDLEEREREREDAMRRREEEQDGMLEEARRKAADDARRRAKVEALEVEKGLRDEIESLEGCLAEKTLAEDECRKILRRTEEESEENMGSLRLMNSSLQDQIISIKGRCNELEKKLRDAEEERDAMRAKLLSSPLSSNNNGGGGKSGGGGNKSELGERQKKLHREFNSLWSALQGMSKDNPGMAQLLSGGGDANGAATAEALAESMQVMTAESEAREQKIKSYRARIVDLERENDSLRNDVRQIKKERIELEEEAKKAKAEAIEAAKKAKEGAPDPSASRRLYAYETQIRELQLKNKSLREKIVKNNETYVSKVEELGEECARLNEEGDQLKRTIGESREECRGLRVRLEECLRREGEGGGSRDAPLASERAEMSHRVNSVANFLVKIADMQERLSSYAARMEDEMRSRRQDAPNGPTTTTLTAAKRDEMESMASAARERGALLKNAVAVQRRELELIAAEIGGKCESVDVSMSSSLR